MPPSWNALLTPVNCLDGPKHQLAMHQFDSNLSAILDAFTQQVPVWLGSLASNYKDQVPFVDVPDAVDAQDQPLPWPPAYFKKVNPSWLMETQTPLKPSLHTQRI